MNAPEETGDGAGDGATFAMMRRDAGTIVAALVSLGWERVNTEQCARNEARRERDGAPAGGDVMSGVDPFKGYRATVSAPVARWETFADMQASPNPLTIPELETLAARHPERWAAFLAIAKGAASS